MMIVNVPDIGDYADVPIIAIHVKTGDVVDVDDPVITLESDKAAMDVPSPFAGTVVDVLVKLGDRLREGSPIIAIEPGEAPRGADGSAPDPNQGEPRSDIRSEPQATTTRTLATIDVDLHLPALADFGGVHASPAVRRLAREFDVDLTEIKGSGEKGRITKEDIRRAIRLEDAGPTGATGVPTIPEQDFAKFGPIETKPLSRLKRLSGPHLHRAWLNVPHVTHIDEADITDLESYRRSLDLTAKEKGYRTTILAFIMKASVVALKEHPEFNASLSPEKDAFIFKRYYHLGVAVDTPDGLVVPVIRDVDRKGILELSQELGTVSAKMRDGKISPSDIQGASFSISSLGGIGGVGFTPIVNAPEVAILGVVRAAMKPVWDGAVFRPRLMLPLCVSYDHRAIDGAQAARFTRRLAELLTDTRQLIL